MNKDEILKVARECGASRLHGEDENYALWGSDIERFAAAMYAAGAADMKERVEISAKKEVSDWEMLRDLSIARKESSLIESTNILAINRLVEVIRSLPITPTNTEGEQDAD